MIGERLDNLRKYLPVEAPIIITDTNVLECWDKHYPQGEIITIGTGEKIKTFDTVRDIYEQLQKLEADRSSFVVGIGGAMLAQPVRLLALGQPGAVFARGLRVNLA